MNHDKNSAIGKRVASDDGLGAALPIPKMYTVTRCRNDDTFYGPVHWSADTNVTFCGLVIDERWYVISNSFDGKATCRKCCKASNAKFTGSERREQSGGTKS